MTELFDDKWEELWNEEKHMTSEDVPTEFYNLMMKVKIEGDKFRRALVQLEIPERMAMDEKLKAIWTFAYGISPSYVSARITEILEGRG